MVSSDQIEDLLAQQQAHRRFLLALDDHWGSGIESIDRIIEPRRCEECNALDGETTTETLGPNTFLSKLKAKLFGLELVEWPVTWCANGHVMSEGLWYDIYCSITNDWRTNYYGRSPIIDVWEYATKNIEWNPPIGVDWGTRSTTFSVSDPARSEEE